MGRKSSSTLTRVAVAAVVTLGIGGGAYWWLSQREPDTSGGTSVTRRITEEQYRNIVADVFGPNVEVGGRFEIDVRDAGLLAVGTGRVSITAAGVEQYDKMARSVAGQVVSEAHRDALFPCAPVSADAPDDACAADFLKSAGRLLYRRPLAKDELQEQVALAAQSAKMLKSFYAGVGTSLATMLVSPQFLFRTEEIEADPAKSGAWRLDGYSKASQLSFLLWNSGPDPELLEAAETGALHSKAGLRQQVDRMLQSPRLETGVRAFFADMLGYDGFATLSKDPVIYPKFSSRVADDAREQTLRTLTHHLLTLRGDYRDVFTTPKTFLTPLLASIYQIKVSVPRGGWMPYEFAPNDPRAGILSQVSFMALHSHPGRSSPTLRGKALREILLCQVVPLPPANVDFKLVQDTASEKFKTVRARLSAHATDPTCAGCHRVIDPIGLALENFDASGGYRTSENGEVIDTSGDLDGNAFSDPVGLGKAVHDSPAAPKCLVDRLAAYGLGRAPAEGEQEWLAHLEQRFQSVGFRLPELLREIVLSPAFYRVEPVAPAGQTAQLNSREGVEP